MSRLTPHRRRSLALSTIIPLSTDDTAQVRSGVLEALGEVVYTFHDDEDGAPEELVRLFLGRKEDRRVRNGQQAWERERERVDEAMRRVEEAKKRVEEPWRSLLRGTSSEPTPLLLPPPSPVPLLPPETPLESFYNDPARPLICAFNYPAFTLTLGRARWEGDVREVYLQLAENRAVKVRRTLAASLGVLANVIGEEHARRDLAGVWWDAIRSEEEEVRMKAVECAVVFAEALGEGGQAREGIVEGLLQVWEEGVFGYWRERETIAKALVGLGSLVGRKVPAVMRGLLRKSLEDNVACVRDAAISAVSLLI